VIINNVRRDMNDMTNERRTKTYDDQRRMMDNHG